MQVGAEIVFDASIEVFNLSIALRMGRSSLGMFDVQDCKKLGRQFVDKFFSTIGVNLNWRRESVDPPISIICATVEASLSGIGTTTAILEKASVMHRTCLLNPDDLRGPYRSTWTR